MALLLSCTPARQDSNSIETFDETLDCRATAVLAPGRISSMAL
jgi:hypothetical protein